MTRSNHFDVLTYSSCEVDLYDVLTLTNLDVVELVEKFCDMDFSCNTLICGEEGIIL